MTADKLPPALSPATIKGSLSARIFLRLASTHQRGIAILHRHGIFVLRAFAIIDHNDNDCIFCQMATDQIISSTLLTTQPPPLTIDHHRLAALRVSTRVIRHLNGIFTSSDDTDSGPAAWNDKFQKIPDALLPRSMCIGGASLASYSPIVKSLQNPVHHTLPASDKASLFNLPGKPHMPARPHSVYLPCVQHKNRRR